jgi:DNA-directed RNA polymerase subunit F
MIKSIKPLSLSEVNDILSEKQESEKINQVKDFAKKFLKIKSEDSKKLNKELEEMGLIKLKQENIAKIIDIMPEDADDVRKIFAEVSLDENEISKILEVTKKYL